MNRAELFNQRCSREMEGFRKALESLKAAATKTLDQLHAFVIAALELSKRLPPPQRKVKSERNQTEKTADSRSSENDGP